MGTKCRALVHGIFPHIVVTQRLSYIFWRQLWGVCNSQCVNILENQTPSHQSDAILLCGMGFSRSNSLTFLHDSGVLTKSEVWTSNSLGFHTTPVYLGSWKFERHVRFWSRRALQPIWWLYIAYRHTTTSITLFRSITMFCGTDSTLRNIPPFRLSVRNIPHNTVSPA